MVGMSDAMGCARSEIIYTEYGEPLVQWIIYCASSSGISTVSYDSTYKETTVTLNGTLPNNLEGKEVRVAVPGDAIRPYRTARVQHASGTTMVLYEPTAGSDETVAAAIDPAGSIGAPFVAYDNPTGMLDGRWDDVTYYDSTQVNPVEWPDGVTVFIDNERTFTDWWIDMTGEFEAGSGAATLNIDHVESGKLYAAGNVHTVVAGDRYRMPDMTATGQRRTNHGILYTAPSYDPGADETTFTVEPLANLASFQVGYKVLLDTRTPTYHTITAAGGDTFTVKGQLTPTMGNTDAHEIGSAGDWFRVMTPYGKDAQTGELDQELSMKGSRQGLWGGYRWMPPEGPNGSTASFSNKYYCHNRTYDTRTGRWSTPDPAASPWANLQDYARGNPITNRDPTGLLLISIMGTGQDENTDDTLFNWALVKKHGLMSDGEAGSRFGKNGLTDWTVGSIRDDEDWVSDAHKVATKICEAKKANSNEPIKIIGFSRGAALALVVAKFLGSCGCCDGKPCWKSGGSTYDCDKDCGCCKKIDIDFLGLIDPVSSDLTGLYFGVYGVFVQDVDDGFVPDAIPSNVKKHLVIRASAWTALERLSMGEHEIKGATEKKLDYAHSGASGISGTGAAKDVLGALASAMGE